MYLRPLLVAGAVLLASCTQQRAMLDATFGDQNFKTAITLIELYRVRHGAYPPSLHDLDFTGEWDQLALGAVQYRKLKEGYALELVRGWVGKPTLQYPREFWSGLGIRESNVRR